MNPRTKAKSTLLQLGFAAGLLLMVTSLPAAGPRHSLVIGVDGLGFGRRGLGEVSTPHIDSLINGSWQTGYRGSHTDQAFAGGTVRTTTQQPTVSGPGWSTILTGVWTDRHGVVDNEFRHANYDENPIYLETLEESVPTVITASFVNWDPIDRRIIASADDGDSRVDIRRDTTSDFAVVAYASRHLGSAPSDVPNAIFVVLDDVDIAGHRCGSSGECYESAILRTDALIGRLLESIVTREDATSEDWQIVLTSDHGHQSRGGHGGHSDLERRIPFIVSSRRVLPGQIESADGPPVSHADVAPTVLDHFGIGTPSHYWGQSRAGGASEIAGDLNLDGVVDQHDIDRLTQHQGDLALDLNLDGVVNLDDRTFWVEQIKCTWFGDSNLDGQFNSDDLLESFGAGQYEDSIIGNSTWHSGDWDGDLDFTSRDLVLAFASGGFERGRQVRPISVPEPASVLITLAGLVVWIDPLRGNRAVRSHCLTG